MIKEGSGGGELAPFIRDGTLMSSQVHDILQLMIANVSRSRENLDLIIIVIN